MPAASLHEMESRVQSWLLEEGFTVKKEGDPTASFNYAVDLGGFGINVGRHILGASDRIQVTCVLELVPVHRKLLEDMGAGGRDRFLWDLRFMLAEKGVDFMLMDAIGRPNSADLHKILLTQSMWFDGLTKDRFMSVLHTVKVGGLMTMWSFQRRQGLSSPDFDPMAP